jgi:membrane fusion protein, multidrug efflux system
MISTKPLISGALIVLTMMGLMLGCSGAEDKSDQNVDKAISVKGMVVKTSSQDLTKSFTGTLEGEKQTAINAKIAEAVDKIMVNEGSLVKTDDVIIRLDRTGPTSNFVQANSVYQNAKKNYNKMENLYKQGAISEMQYDGTKTEYEVARANYNAVLKTVDITTPIDGTVTSIDVSAGDYVYPGQQVATVAALDKLRMKFGVSDVDIGYFNEGDAVRIIVESATRLVGNGKVVTAAESADPTTRTFQIEIELDNSANQFKPGMFGRAEIIVEKFDDIIVVPRSAVVIRNNENYAFIVHGDKVTAQEVKLGVEFDGSVQILSGLNQGDTLVTVGQEYLDDGIKVKLAELDGSSIAGGN